jgi:hypothetical protein
VGSLAVIFQPTFVSFVSSVIYLRFCALGSVLGLPIAFKQLPISFAADVEYAVSASISELVSLSACSHCHNECF